MKRAKRFSAISVATFLIWECLFCPAVVQAGDAMDIYQEGISLFNEGKYEKAAEKFESAYKARPTWKLLYNIGQSYAACKRYGLAIENFEQYLLQGGDDVSDGRIDYVTNELRRMQPLVGLIEMQAPVGTEVSVDGTKRGEIASAGPLE